jgi:hypothetical protein
MIKNIPNKYTLSLLKAKIDLKFKNLYDFLYLPMDIQVILISLKFIIKYK